MCFSTGRWSIGAPRMDAYLYPNNFVEVLIIVNTTVNLAIILFRLWQLTEISPKSLSGPGNLT